MAADQLFAELPKAVRRHLGNLPGVVRRLETDTRRMRARLEELEEAVGETPVPSAGHLAGTVSRNLRAERDRLHRQLADTVSALEGIRLGLLRLRSGSGDLPSLTTDLAAARSVGDAVNRLLEGQAEVDAVLHRPITPATPSPAPGT